MDVPRKDLSMLDRLHDLVIRWVVGKRGVALNVQVSGERGLWLFAKDGKPAIVGNVLIDHLQSIRD